MAVGHLVLGAAGLRVAQNVALWRQGQRQPRGIARTGVCNAAVGRCITRSMSAMLL
jgi:hypothetical protein